MLDKPSVQLYNTRYHKENQTMRIDVEDIIENDDGSATLTLDMDSTALQALLSFAVVEALKNGIKDQTDSRQLKLDI